MKKKDLWINNFSGIRVGYHLCCPWSGYGMYYGQKVFFGKKIITEHFCHMKGLDLIAGYIKKSELRNIVEKTLDKIFQDPDFVEKNHKEAYKLNKDFFDYAEEILKLDLKSLSDKKLGLIFHKFIYSQEQAHAHAIATTWFVDSDGQDLTNKYLVLCEEYVKKSNTTRKVSEVFSLLTTPAKISLLNQEEIESLTILEEIIKDTKSLIALKSLKDFDTLPNVFPTFLQGKITKHIKKWSWTPFGYLGPAYKLSDYLKHWQEQIEKEINPKKEKLEKKNRPKNVEKERMKLKKELGISQIHAQIFDIGADIVFLKGYRKDCSFHGFYVLDKLLSEIAGRTYLSKNQLNAMCYLEVIDILKGVKKPNIDLVNDRLKNETVLLHYKQGIKVISGQKARNFLKKGEELIEREIVDKETKVFKGVCACSGYAKGVVKIINTPEEMPKMEQGNIMISHTTFPSLVPAMNKAAAIATEDGGITCHAAIVSRELGIPCVTGIKILTKVLKDGDLVEVDANTGVIKILSK